MTQKCKCATWDKIIGQKITGTRKLTKKELEENGWEEDSAIAIQLENGVEIWTMRDEEGNGPGVFIAHHLKTGEQKYLW
jgi:hypothetical protein